MIHFILMSFVFLDRLGLMPKQMKKKKKKVKELNIITILMQTLAFKI